MPLHVEIGIRSSRICQVVDGMNEIHLILFQPLFFVRRGDIEEFYLNNFTLFPADVKQQLTQKSSYFLLTKAFTINPHDQNEISHLFVTLKKLKTNWKTTKVAINASTGIRKMKDFLLYPKALISGPKAL